jgi:RNA polymerase sigma-70 factor (ECF subfamily)
MSFETIQALLDRQQEALSRSWPGVGVDVASLRMRLQRQWGDSALATELASLHLVDLALADAAARGDQRALEVLEHSLIARVPDAARRYDSSDEFAQTLQQNVRIALLVGEKNGPRIDSYTGRGPLLHWVLVVATRLAIDLKRREAKEDGEDDLLDLMDWGDPLAKRESRALLKTWIQEGLSLLDAQERAVLQLYFVEEVPSQTIAIMFGVHRATVARWLEHARDQLRSHVRRRALATPGMGADALNSLLRAADGYVSLSLSLLRS